jgi:hypothetical protein
LPDPDDGTDEHPYDAATSALADMAERAVEYSNIWRKAIERNAAGEYQAEHALVDGQALWGLAARDTARLSAVMLQAFAPMVPKDAFRKPAAGESPSTD